MQMMLDDLKSTRLEVALVDAPSCKHRGHKVRTVVSRNPVWYQDLCSRYTKVRSGVHKRTGHRCHDTRINRVAVIRLLAHWIRSGYTISKYAGDLCELAEAQLQQNKLEDERYS